MVTLTLDLTPQLYARLRAEAERLGQPCPDMAQRVPDECVTVRGTVHAK